MNQTSQPDSELHSLLQDLWRRHLPATRERLDQLEKAIRIAAAGDLAENQRAEAQATAHKLSGNLGMFGYTEAGEAASEIEHLFKGPTPKTIPALRDHMLRLRTLLAGHL
jgi:HPt (histidine-containing phosphotransfer) domain-containing protein